MAQDQERDEVCSEKSILQIFSMTEVLLNYWIFLMCATEHSLGFLFPGVLSNSWTIGGAVIDR